MRAAVVTVSTTRDLSDDESGAVLAKGLEELGVEVARRELVVDDERAIATLLRCLVDAGSVDLIVTTGGTGLAASDVTPEATRRVIDRELPGIAEALRADAIARTPRGMLSRGVSGVCGACLIVNLPGSPRACKEGVAVLAPVLAHALALIGDQPVDH